VKKSNALAPRRASTTKAEKLAREIVRDLGHDREAIELVRRVAQELTRRSRGSRRQN
jgi:hypothetical protein